MPQRRPANRMAPGLQEKLDAAQREADKFNSMKPSQKRAQQVYSSSVFSLEEELNLLKDNNIIDEGWKNQTMEDINMSKTPSEMERDALKAAGFVAEATQTEEQPIKESEQPPKEQKPLTEDEQFAIVSQELVERFGDRAPKMEVLRQWKNMYRNIFILDLGDKDLFIYRYLNRQEWQQINADQGWLQLSPLKQEEYIVNKCLLFPNYSPTEKGMLPGGAYSTLAEQIRIQSMFLPATYVANMTMKI